MSLCGGVRPRPRGDSARVARPAHRCKPSCADLTNMCVPQRTSDMSRAAPKGHQLRDKTAVRACSALQEL
eukprot:10529818-Alexandrium_andersonii.AAC.1